MISRKLFCCAVSVFGIAQYRNDTPAMTATLQFDPELYSEKALKLILATAQREGCTPAEAVVKILNEWAKRKKRAA